MTDKVDHEYWEISLGEAFEEAEIPLPPEEKFQILVGFVSGCAQVKGEVLGRDLISDPRDEEISTLKRQLESEKEETRKKELIYQEKIASRYGYPEEISVAIVGNEVEVEYRNG